MAYVLFTDSCCDLPLHYYEENEIKVVPLSCLIGNDTFEDRMVTDEQFHTFYQRVRGGEMPSTTQVNADQFINMFEPALAQGNDVLYVGFSSALSGTFNSARLAREELSEKYPDRKIISLDSACASMGQGLLLYQANLLKKQGKSIDEVAEWIEQNKLNLHHWFTVDDLHHLHRGGRVSGAAAVVGTLIGIKPVLHVDNQGRLIPQEKVRGRKRALKALVDHMEQSGTDIGKSPIFISHGDCLEDAQAVAEMIKQRFGATAEMINYIGPVIGSHSGPGTVALFFMGQNREAHIKK